MSTITSSSTAGASGRTAWVGIAAAVGGSALAYYGAYGDPHAKSSQESAVPFLIGLSCVVAGLAFTLVVPRMSRVGAPRIWPLGTGIVAVLLMPVAFWSGVPLVLGAAAVFGGQRARSKATVALGVLAVLGSLAMAILGNTVLSSS
jgi:hypothetical protein